MKGLRSSLFTFVFFLVLSGSSNLIAQCSTSSCTNSNPVCPNSSCCQTGGNPNSISSPPVATVDDIGNYNCHQFVKAYIYGNHSGEKIFDCDNYSECPCYNYNIGSFTAGKEFVRVQWESQAAAIYYPCDHSAVKLGSYQYMSKDGHGGHLYKHGPTAYAVGSGCYPYTFWAYLGEIGGFSGSTISGPVQLSLKNNSGITYEWCANPSNMVSITNGNTANPTITPTGNGNVQIKVTTTGYGGSKKTQCKNFNVTVPSECGNSSINGTITNSGYSTSLYSYNNIFYYSSKVNLSTSAHHFTWVKTGGNASYNVSYNGKSANLYMYGGQYLQFTIEAYSSSNVCLGSRNVFFQCSTIGSNWLNTQSEKTALEIEKTKHITDIDDKNEYSEERLIHPISSKAAIYPNPARDIINIELIDNNIKAVELFDTNGRNILKKSMNIITKTHQLDLSQVQPGIYYVRILDSQNYIVMQKILVQ